MLNARILRLLISELPRSASWFLGSLIILTAVAGKAIADTPIQMAINTLQIDHPLPPGWHVYLSNQASGNSAETDPDGKTITIYPAAIAANYPHVTEPTANLPGVLYIMLLHEWYHAQECGGGTADAGGGGHPPYNTAKRVCGDVQLVPGIAADHCALIQSIIQNGNGNIGPLCALYNDIASNYNSNAYSRYVGAHCTGAFPGPIPPCIGCGS
jgi:hypothetical protein